MSSPSPVSNLYNALVVGIPVLINPSGKIEQIKLWKRFCFYFDKKYFSENNIQIAQFIINRLDELAEESEKASRSPADIEKLEIFRVARFFLRRATKEMDGCPIIDECIESYKSARVCLTKDTIKNNPGFGLFIRSNYLDHYLIEYQHRLVVEEGVINVPFEIEDRLAYRAWSEIAKDSDLIDEEMKLQNRYGYRGITEERNQGWQDLPIHKVGNSADWGQQYVFEICVCCKDLPRVNGDHAWIRLKTPDGIIYSIGVSYESSEPYGNCSDFLTLKKGLLNSPDLFEFDPEKDFFTLPIVITEKQFLVIKKTIEEDNRSDTFLFHCSHLNCVTYICERLAPIAGIRNLSIRSLYPLLVFPMISRKIIESLTPFLPKIVLQCIAVSGNIFPILCNIIQWAETNLKRSHRIKPFTPLMHLPWTLSAFFILSICGARRVDTMIQDKVKPIIGTWYDLLNPKLAFIFHPYTLGKVIQEICLWREKQISQISNSSLNPQTREITVNKLKYDLPSYLKTNHE